MKSKKICFHYNCRQVSEYYYWCPDCHSSFDEKEAYQLCKIWDRKKKIDKLINNENKKEKV